MTLPLCHFHSVLEVLALCSHILRAFGSRVWPRTIPGNGRACAFLCLPPCNNRGPKLSSDQPMSKSHFCTQPPSRTNILPTCRCISVQSSFVFLRSRARAGSSLMLCYPTLPVNCPGLLQQHLLHIFRAHTFHVNSSIAFKYQGLPMRPLGAQISGFAHHRSCWTSHLPPRFD